MLCIRKSLTISGFLCFLCGGLIWSVGTAFPQVEGPFRGNEPIEELVVELTIGPNGNDLDVPVALDLGLGFPLWLAPVGIDEGTVPPFGAVPQTSTASQVLSPGATGTFTFRVETEDVGQDVFRATPQLLAGVQISDIARIGFTTNGSADWVLEGYQISINGHPFAAAQGVNLSPKQVGEMNQTRLGEVAVETATIQPDIEALQALVDAGFAADEDQQRLTELFSQHSALLAERSWLEGQFNGVYPWYVDGNFENPFRNETAVNSVKVTLVTDIHVGADSHNAIYFQIGAHKYRVSDLNNPLSAEFGPQEFDLDLRTGPLTTADLRSFAVGMIGDTTPFGAAPDRWHPQRILVEVDGRNMYDSDESPIDRLSLEAVRLIPPAHVDERNRLVFNVPTARELFVWTAGQGAGLNLTAGGAVELPDPGDPLFPGAERGLDPEAFPPDDGFVGIPLFPGEFGPGWGGGAVWWPPEWGVIPPWCEPLLPWLIPFWPLPPGLDPPAIGEPFQIENVRIADGWMVLEPYTITWGVAGDESAIDHYTVMLVEVQPDQDPPVILPALADVDVPVGTRSVELMLDQNMPTPPGRFLQPVVVAVPIVAANGMHHESGPVKPLLRGRNEMSLNNVYQIDNNWFEKVVAFGEDPGDEVAVWTFGEQESHNGLLFDDGQPAWNVGVRFPQNTKLELSFRESGFGLSPTKYRLAAQAGFLGIPDPASNIKVKLSIRFSWIDPNLGGGIQLAAIDIPAVQLVNPAGDPPKPLTLITQEFNTADFAGANECRTWVRVEFSGTVDPAHPPALFGVHIAPTPQMNP